MNISDPVSRMCLAMVAGLVLVSAGAGDDRGQGRGDQPLRFAGPLAVHPKNPRYFVDGSGKAIYLGGHQVFTEIQDNAWTKPWVLDWPRHLQFMKERNLNYLRNWIIFSTGGSDDRILPWKALTRGYHYSIYDHPFENRRDEGPSWELARRNVGAAVLNMKRTWSHASDGLVTLRSGQCSRRPPRSGRTRLC